MAKQRSTGSINRKKKQRVKAISVFFGSLLRSRNILAHFRSMQRNLLLVPHPCWGNGQRRVTTNVHFRTCLHHAMGTTEEKVKLVETRFTLINLFKRIFASYNVSSAESQENPKSFSLFWPSEFLVHQSIDICDINLVNSEKLWEKSWDLGINKNKTKKNINAIRNDSFEYKFWRYI